MKFLDFEVIDLLLVVLRGKSLRCMNEIKIVGLIADLQVLSSRKVEP